MDEALAKRQAERPNRELPIGAKGTGHWTKVGDYVEGPFIYGAGGWMVMASSDPELHKEARRRNEEATHARYLRQQERSRSGY